MLDNDQETIAKTDNKNLLVVAGAGSGKTLTILGKIKHLINSNIKEDEILCISFTNASSISLKNKIKNELNLNIDVYTFHKLGLNILSKEKYTIASDDLLLYIIDDIFNKIIIDNKNIIFKYIGVKNICEYYKKINQVNNLKKLLCTFIKLFKSNNHKLEDFILFKKRIKNIFNIKYYYKEKYFLIIAINIYIEYSNYLKENNEIDFDDMLILSTIYNIERDITYKYKYIIIDEFQDTSLIRLNLIKSIMNKTNSNILAVGDDYQSIYRFTGCDLDIFLNFEKLFDNTKILKINNTYRNSNELINIANKFIMRNKKQIKKELVSQKHLDNPIEIVYFNNNVNSFIKLIEYVYNNGFNNILVLGRNNNDVYNYIDINFKFENDKLIYLKNKNIVIKYLTIHKSKGLESDVVIVLNNTNNINGFPSKIKSERILRVVNNEKDYFPYEEERRLMYVALTRTKNRVYLVTEKNNESIFILELLNYKEVIKKTI